MQIHNLQNISLEQISECFNKAFETYFVPIKMDVQQLSDKIKSENILLEYSVGVTVNELLVGFILTGIDAENKLSYNAGTGVIPEFRRQKLTEQMYAFLFPILKKGTIQKQLLEVISENQKALKIYDSLGYEIVRKVVCYKGKVIEYKNSNYRIQAIELPTENEIKPFWNHNPTYQNSIGCIKNNLEKHTILGTYNEDLLIGYIVFDKNTLRVKQFGIDKSFRSKGIGKQLFYEVQHQIPEKEISIINVDENDFETNKFLGKIGLKPFIEQYEMVLNTV